MSKIKTKDELIKENTELKKLLKDEQKKNDKTIRKCWSCDGSGKTWNYWDGDTYCHECSGRGFK